MTIKTFFILIYTTVHKLYIIYKPIIRKIRCVIVSRNIAYLTYIIIFLMNVSMLTLLLLDKVMHPFKLYCWSATMHHTIQQEYTSWVLPESHQREEGDILGSNFILTTTNSRYYGFNQKDS